MADTIQAGMKEYEDIKDEYPFWNQFPLMDLLYKKGRQPLFVAFTAVLDTLGAALAAIKEPTNPVVNFAAPKQLFIRSSAAGDTDKSCYIVGQKADGSFGKFKVSTDGTDGTTPVNLGLWNVVFFTNTFESAAGNLIIDDDGASTTIYYTLALGVAPGDLLIYVPTGYKSAVLDFHAFATDVPATVATDAVFFNLNKHHISMLPVGAPSSSGRSDIHGPIAAESQMIYNGRYDTAIIPSQCSGIIVFWAA